MTYIIYFLITFGFFVQIYFVRDLSLSTSISSSIIWPIPVGMLLGDMAEDLRLRNLNKDKKE